MHEKHHILLVEDDAHLGYLLQQYIVLHELEVVWVKTAKLALEAFREGRFDLCIFDVNLPDQDGFSLARQIRMLLPDQPFLFLTARTLKTDKLLGFKLGADDYLCKPIDEEEMMARIRAILHRTSRQAPFAGQKLEYQIGDFVFDPAQGQLRLGEVTRQLTLKESQLLDLLCQQKGKILDRKTSLRLIWGEVDYFTRKSMDVYISKLRKYLAEDTRVQIRNIHGQGFVLDIPPK